MMQSGEVKFFAQDKGYGFILPDDRGGDVFFHFRNWANPGLSRRPDFYPFHIRVLFEHGQWDVPFIFPFLIFFLLLPPQIRIARSRLATGLSLSLSFLKASARPRASSRWMMVA